MAKHKSKKSTQPQRTASPRKKYMPWILCAGGLILAALLLVTFLTPSAPPPSAETFPQLEVAGYRISREEYIRAMYQARNDVLSDHAAAGISLKNWKEETALGDPCQLVTQRTLEILQEYYAISSLAVERGYLADASYDAMLRDMEEINRKRQEAIAAGEVVTGMPNFTLEDYISYRTSSIRLQFCNDPDNPDARVTQEEILQRYEADKENLYSQPDYLELAFFLINTTPEEADALEQDLLALRQLALEKGDLADALVDMPQLEAYFQEATIDQTNYGIYDRAYVDVLVCAGGLQSGDISQVFRQEGWLCLVQCRQRISGNYASLEDISSVVEQSIRESRYDDLIARRMEEMEISADLQALYRFTADQFT